MGLVVRLSYLVLIAADNPLSGDASSYHLAANLWADGLGFPEPLRHLFGGMDTVLVDGGATTVVQTPIGHVEPTAGHPPIWTMILGVASFLGATSIIAQQFVAVLMGLPAIVLMGLLGREVRSERLGLLAAALTAVYAFIWVNDGLLMAETAAIGAATATMLMGVRFWRAPTVRSAAVLGLVGGVAALTRAELVLFLPLVAGVVLFRSTLPWRSVTRSVVSRPCFCACHGSSAIRWRSIHLSCSLTGWAPSWSRQIATPPTTAQTLVTGTLNAASPPRTDAMGACSTRWNVTRWRAIGPWTTCQTTPGACSRS